MGSYYDPEIYDEAEFQQRLPVLYALAKGKLIGAGYSPDNFYFMQCLGTGNHFDVTWGENDNEDGCFDVQVDGNETAGYSVLVAEYSLD